MRTFFQFFYLQVRRPSSAVLAAAPLFVCLSQVAVQYRHIYVQSDLPSKYNLAVEHSASGHLPAIYWRFQDPSMPFRRLSPAAATARFTIVSLLEPVARVLHMAVIVVNKLMHCIHRHSAFCS